MSTDSCPIEVFDTAPSKTMRADEIANKTAKTSKVTAVVVVMSIYCGKNKKNNTWSADPGNKMHFCYKAESAKFLEVNSH
jgi:hypothetical protein